MRVRRDARTWDRNLANRHSFEAGENLGGRCFVSERMGHDPFNIENRHEFATWVRKRFHTLGSTEQVIPPSKVGKMRSTTPTGTRTYLTNLKSVGERRRSSVLTTGENRRDWDRRFGTCGSHDTHDRLEPLRHVRSPHAVRRAPVEQREIFPARDRCRPDSAQYSRDESARAVAFRHSLSEQPRPRE